MRRTITLVSLICLIAGGTMSAQTADYPYQPVPFTSVKVTDGFWGPRFETNRKVTVWYDFKKCEETGRIANFARAGGLEKGKFQGIPFNDSDVFKVMEGAAYLLAQEKDEKLDKYLDDLIAKIAAAQEDDGYLYSARTLGFTNGMTGPERWSHLAHNHELYNVGHMYEGAVAHYQATGKRNFLDVAIKNADLLCKVFGPNEGQLVDVPGHEEIEIGLVRLYRVTGEKKYLDLAKFFVDMRGRKDKRGKVYGEYAQDHVPIVEQQTAVGHAVRGGYLYAGVADVAAIVGDKAYVEAIDRIWDDVITRKIYLIGNVGQHGAGEGYAGAYKLSNVRAYNETCAAIALALWNQRMFLLHGDAKYIDVLERTLYNGFLSGVSLKGDSFFYPNPLTCNMSFKFNHGSFERSPWFGCSCCPVNVVRFIPAVAGYVYAQRDDNLYVNLFVNGTGEVKLPAGEVKLTQSTDYPWSGKTRIELGLKQAARFAVLVRVPGWARGRPVPSDLYTYANDTPAKWKLTVNGKTARVDMRKGYAAVAREWRDGDTIELDLPMDVRRAVANEKVEPNLGRVALERGPLVYCAEGADNAGKVLNMYLPDETALTAEHRAGLLGGVTVLRGKAMAARRTSGGKVESQATDIALIPYYAWCHRGPNEMQVWLPRTVEKATPTPMPTIASRSKVSASHHYRRDHIGALNDQIDPKHSCDHEVPRFTWWDHRGTEEWVQYDFAKSAKVSQVEIYWFDDTGRGQCRVPKSWKLLYRDGKQWQPVEAKGEYGVAKDKHNKVEFSPVETSALRVAVQLAPDVSGGILEWRVK